MRYAGFTAAVMLLLTVLTLRAVGEEAHPRRAKPPRWSEEVLDVFFVDAREHLVGTRPATGAVKTQAALGQKNAGAEDSDTPWASLIDADTLTAEIKRVINGLNGAFATPGFFKREGHQQCQRDFSLLAVLFGIVREFDEQVRWQRDASEIQSLLLQAADDCREASDQSLVIAKQMQTLLIDLIRGQPLQQAASAESSLRKESVDRAQLMLRMELAVEEIVAPGLANKKVFRRGSANVAHEGQVLAALAKVITQEGFDDSDDEGFVEYARQFGDASAALSRASREGNYEAARAAAGRVTQSCSNCHEDYRG